MLATAAVVALARGPASADAQPGVSPPTPVVDHSAHRERLVVANGARLQVLDWGGHGPVLLFLPGFGSGAHIFDGLAPAFTDRFHVLALTPRGFPPSTAPDSGYTIAQLAADVRTVLDSLGAAHAVLAGHSISGAVITRFAEAYPERLLAAVYLDAAFDFAAADRRSRAARLNGPSPPADTTVNSFVAWRRRFPDWDSVRKVDSRMWDRDSADVAHRQALVMSLVTEVRGHSHDVWSVRAPALAICAVGSVERRYGWLTPDSARWRAARAAAEQDQRGQRATCDAFRRKVPRGQALSLESGHFVFIDRRDAVVRAMRRFLAGVTAQGT